jgi:hypothetical protein
MPRRLRTWAMAVGLFAAVAFGTAKVYALDCVYHCEECTIVYLDCGACGGDDCDGWGAACSAFCWDCGGGMECEPLTQ